MRLSASTIVYLILAVVFFNLGTWIGGAAWLFLAALSTQTSDVD